MLKVRKTKTGSGATAVQVIYYRNRKLIVEKHIGSGSTNQEIEDLVVRGKNGSKIKVHKRNYFRKVSQTR